MKIDTASVDEALTTTRSVRLRLDLERPVDNRIILDCIDVAEQAPTGGNQGSRRWLVVRDPKLKQGLSDLYNDAIGRWMIEARDRHATTGHPNYPQLRSAAHLAEHLADVPAIVIPTIIGRYDGSGRPGLFDSVIQSAWSFCVALRARGLGSAWTTAVLTKGAELKELLGIPAEMTEIVMLPVAWTKGTDFHRVPRRPARKVTFFDGYARIYESGPSSPIRLADGPGTMAEVDIPGAEVADVWPLICDIDLPARFSEEFLGASWAEGFDGPALGATFVGRNQHPAVGEWEVPCFVDVYEPEAVFGWCTSDPENPGARWRFELVRIIGAIRLRFELFLGPGPSGLSWRIAQEPDKEPRFISGRLREHRTNMCRVVEGIKELVGST